ncbi:MAG: 2-phospho-L-lactate guanylyltransferase [Methanonatronarchaeales archaeon]|nr:2-phospho-L-lactate guanylyltransferase [Methanonatronarchaeales archaeon]
MRVVVPFRAQDAKTGLSTVFSRVEREALAEAMLSDVLAACEGLKREVVSPSPPDSELDAEVVVDDAPLNEALEARLEHGLPVLILPADVPLVRGRDVEALLAEEGDVVIAPGLRGGTNGLLLRERIPLRYGGLSFERHLSEGEERGFEVTVHESFRFAVDIDGPRDLFELEIHGGGEARGFLEDVVPKV